MAKVRTYRLSPHAEADLEDIFAWTVKRWSVDQALSYHGALVTAFEELAAGTKIGRGMDVVDGYYKSFVASHVVFYRLTEDSVDVIRVLHQAMDVDGHLKP